MDKGADRAGLEEAVGGHARVALGQVLVDASSSQVVVQGRDVEQGLQGRVEVACVAGVGHSRARHSFVTSVTHLNPGWVKQHDLS